MNVERLMQWPFEDVVQTYTARDSMLYALGIGLGQDPLDPAQLRFVYEGGDAPAAFPTMAVVLGHPGMWTADPATGIARAQQVHGEQGIVIHRPLQPAGRLRGRTRVTGVVDKGAGRGALLYTERLLVDDESGEPVATLSSTSFCRGDGGFGGPTGPVKPVHAIPDRSPDVVAHLPTLAQAALIYRLSGDLNALHADPGYAAKAGFERPILHGLCTFGIAAWAVLRECCGGDPAALRSFAARFSAPVFPGETITVELWRDGGTVSFRAWVSARNARVLDNGKAEIATPD
ncbi:MAG: MaoC/PaaZ C-terminal domain-containing protein [Pseudomonadota bacterium]